MIERRNYKQSRLSLLKKTPSSSTPLPLQNPLTFSEQKRLSVLAYPNESSGGLYEGYFDDHFGKCFCPLLINRIAFGSPHSRSYQSGVGQRPAKSLRSRTPFRIQKIALHRGSSQSSFSSDPPLVFPTPLSSSARSSRFAKLESPRPVTKIVET